MNYFKTSKPEAIAAQRQYVAECAAVQRAGEAFAALYPGARAIFKSDAFGRKVHGLAFTPALTSPLWTRPLPSSGMIQRPRTAPKADARGEERRRQIDELGALNAEWNERMPLVESNREPLWEALGIDWGSVLIGGFQCFEQGDCLYFATAVQPQEGWVEIVGSEYNRALGEHKAAARGAEHKQAA